MRLRALAAHTGDPLSAIDASKPVGHARETVEVPAVANGGEIVPDGLPPDVADTVRDPNTMTLDLRMFVHRNWVRTDVRECCCGLQRSKKQI